VAEVGRNIPDAVFFEAPINHSAIRAVKNKTHGFGFESLDQDTVKERYEGLDGFKRSLGNSSLCTRSADDLQGKDGAYHDGIWRRKGNTRVTLTKMMLICPKQTYHHVFHGHGHGIHKTTKVQ
jgi:hypothetical protein